MSRDWIKMRIDLYEDPAILEMADLLGERPETIVGYCHKFWSWVSRQCNADSVTGVTPMLLDRTLNVTGFADAMIAVEWLESGEINGRPYIRIPKFERHLSETAKKRALTAERVRKSRNADVTQGVTQRALQKCYQEKEKEKEKEKEEKKTPPSPPGGIAAFPPCLDSEEFRSAWDDWEAHRKAKRQKLTPQTIKAQIAKCEGWGEAKAVLAIRQSIEHGWTGLFEPGGPAAKQPQANRPSIGQQFLANLAKQNGATE